VGGSCGVAAAAAHHELASWVSALGYFLDVVCGEVGGLVGWLPSPPGAPITDDGAVVGDDAAPSLSLSVVVEVGASCSLDAVALALAAVAVGLAAYDVGASSVAAGAGERTAHRGLRLRVVRRRSSAAQGGQRSPYMTGPWQPR